MGIHTIGVPNSTQANDYNSLGVTPILRAPKIERMAPLINNMTKQKVSIHHANVRGSSAIIPVTKTEHIIPTSPETISRIISSTPNAM